MRKFMVPAVLAAMAAAIGSVPSATAQDADKKVEKPAEKQAATGKMVTDAELFQMIDNLGYEITSRTPEGDANPSVTIKIENSSLTFWMTLNLSRNKTKVWSFVKLADFTPEHEANAPALLKLLALNDDIGPNHFRYNAKTKRLWLCRCIDNGAIMPKILKQNIDYLARDVVETRPAWEAQKWQGAAKTVTQQTK